MSGILHVKCPLLLSDLNETWIFLTDFYKYSNAKFNENPSSGSRVVQCGQTDGRTDVTELIVTFRNFANAPKYEWRCISISPMSSCLMRGQIYIFKRPSVGVPTHIFHNRPKGLPLTHCWRVTQICVFNTVKLGTSASSP